jgi:hypothetical protein
MNLALHVVMIERNEVKNKKIATSLFLAALLFAGRWERLTTR